MSDNLFVLSGQDQSIISEDKIPEFVKDTSTEYIAIVRFRNLEDHNNFANLIGQPDLRKFIKNGKTFTEYPKDTSSSLEDLFGE